MLIQLPLVALLLSPPQSAEQFDGVRDFIRSYMDYNAIPSVSVAVAQDGKILWEQGFGWADQEQRVAANQHTMYSLASVTKPFTATALMTLVEHTRINLDDPANQYLGDAKVHALVGSASDATIRRIANHSSGLPQHALYFAEPLHPPSMDETILRFGNLVRPPGQAFQYSNLGYAILGHVISRVSGKSYEDYMRENVFQKLGLTHTSVGIAPGLEKFAAIRYDSNGKALPNYDLDHRPAAAIYSSAHDLVSFGMFHLKAHLANQSPIISDAAIDEMQRRTILSNPSSGNGYGIGWHVADDPNGYHSVTHPGSLPGVSTMLRLVPSEKLAVVVLINTGGDNYARQISDEILAALLPKWRKPNPPFPGLVGKWTGTLPSGSTTFPITLEILASGEVRASSLGLCPTRLRVPAVNLTNTSVTVGILLEACGSAGRTLQMQLGLQDGLLRGTVNSGGGGPLYSDSATDRIDLKKN